MVVLGSRILLLMRAHLPVPPDGWNIANGSAALLNVVIYVALVELALAAAVAIACGLTLFAAGILTTADLSPVPRRLRRVASDSVAEEPSLAA